MTDSNLHDFKKRIYFKFSYLFFGCAWPSLLHGLSLVGCGLLFLAVCGLLIAVAYLVVHAGIQASGGATAGASVDAVQA